MARVFLSYRRADGHYAVGWIAERLRRLDEATDVRTAFRDDELRCGDDFPSALEAKIASCDVLVAVIGPSWHGHRADGTNRISEPGDWVGREIATALSTGKSVLPVLVGGVEPLVPGDLSAELRPLVDLHAVRFETTDDLDKLTEDVAARLDAIDKARATLAGLDQPIELQKVTVGPVVALLAVLAALVGAWVGWGITQAFVGDSAEAVEFGANDGLWTGIAMVEVGLWCFLAVLGAHYFHSHFRDDIHVSWRPVLTTFAVGGLLLAWVILAFGATAPIRFDAQRTWLLATLPLLLLSPWVVTAMGTAWTRPAVERHALGRRARVLGELRRASRVSFAVLALAVVPGALSTAGIDRALRGMEPSRSSYEPHEILAFGAFLSFLLAGAAVWSRARLRQESIALEADLKELAPFHQRYAAEHLVQSEVERRDWWVIAALATPLAASVVALAL